MENKNELFCEVCDYNANRVCDFNKHIKTKKHYINYSIMVKNKQAINSYECVCGKKFLHKHSVYRHRKQCEEYTKYILEINNKTNDETINNNSVIDNAFQGQIALILVEQLQKKDQFMQQCLQKKDEQIDKLMNEIIQIKNTISSQSLITAGNNNTINTKINTNVNMALFLDNYCKNAINMSDFMKSMEVQLCDLLHTKDNGIIKGISNIFLNRLKELDIYERPIHCTDTKRLTMFVKDDDVWLEGDKGKQKISDSIQNISALQIKKIPDWEEAYSKKLDKEDLDDQYMKIVNSTSKFIGEKEEEKILRNIAKDVSINKKSLEITE